MPTKIMADVNRTEFNTTKNVYRLHALKNPPKGVSFSEFIRTFAMPFEAMTLRHGKILSNYQ